MWRTKKAEKKTGKMTFLKCFKIFSETGGINRLFRCITGYKTKIPKEDKRMAERKLLGKAMLRELETLAPLGGFIGELIED